MSKGQARLGQQAGDPGAWFKAPGACVLVRDPSHGLSMISHSSEVEIGLDVKGNLYSLSTCVRPFSRVARGAYDGFTEEETEAQRGLGLGATSWGISWRLNLAVFEPLSGFSPLVPTS